MIRCILIDDESKLNTPEVEWQTILSQSKLGADYVHNFESVNKDSFTHARFSIFPDGGVSRMRLLGRKK